MKYDFLNNFFGIFFRFIFRIIFGLACLAGAAFATCSCIKGRYICYPGFGYNSIENPCSSMRVAFFASNDEFICELCPLIDTTYAGIQVTVSTSRCGCLQPCCSKISGCDCGEFFITFTREASEAKERSEAGRVWLQRVLIFSVVCMSVCVCVRSSHISETP